MSCLLCVWAVMELSQLRASHRKEMQTFSAAGKHGLEKLGRVTAAWHSF